MAVNVKMGVDLSSFNSGIKSAKAEVKTLDQQMKMIEATFKATGDAEGTMSQKIQTLNKQMEAQKKVASQAEQALKEMTSAGVDPASASYQKMARELLLAQTGMMETQAALNGLGSSAQEAAGNADELTNSVKNIGKKVSLDQVISGIDKIASGLENAAKKAIKLGKAVATEVLGAGTWADDLITTAKAYGISTDELQRMQKTAEIIDTSVDDIMKARQRLGKNSEALNELLGISTNGRSIEDVFWETGEAIMSMSDAFAQEEAAQKLFGKSWRDLVPLFDAGREEYERINNTWSTVSDEQLQSLQELDDKYQTLKNDLETLKMEALSKLAEPMAKLIDSLSELIKSDAGQQAISDAIGALSSGLEWIAENKDGVVAALVAIGGALGALKVSEGVLTVVKTIDGLKGLLGLGGGDVTAAAGSGGTSWVSGLMTKASGSITSLLGNTALQNFAPAFGDWFMHNTTIGHWIMGTETPEQTLAGIRQNASTFAEDWNNNVLFRGLMQGLTGGFMYGTGGEGGFDENEELIRQDLQNMMDAEPFDFIAEPVVSEDAAASIAAQIGTVPVYVSFVGGAGGGGGGKYSYLAEHANGLPLVPYDGYLARLHKGERVVPAREVQSRSYNSNLYVESMYMNNGTDAAGLAAAMAAAQRRTMSGFGS